MRKCLITGCDGLIGQRLTELMGVSAELYLLTHRPELADRYREASHVHVINGDLAKTDFTQALPSTMDSIIHLAQSDHFRDFPDQARDIFSVNTMSTLQLLDYARNAGVTHFAYASSGAVFSQKSSVLQENMSLVADSSIGFYGVSKLSSEMLVSSFQSFMRTSIFRFFFVYGPQQNSSMLIPRLIHSINEGRPIQLLGTEGLLINPIYVDDAVSAVMAAENKTTSEVYHIAGNEIISLKRIGNMIGEKIQKKPVYQISEGSSGQMTADVTKMRELLIVPKFTVSEGLSLTLSAQLGLKLSC